ncbi:MULTISPECIES: alpha-L-rhamnosidase C-terminal domain-containing protein [unclassified Lactobacillus]|uniref:alpha-L-rhamnosidase-related protein n=1 Tax=unclassified Lactobacillus TaxID=2620435 RepID=UPI001F3F6DF6|nr:MULTISPECIES: alpha-L-rhamnosidase C-terminal domain-containing protein [unclassified Lactobacillus]
MFEKVTQTYAVAHRNTENFIRRWLKNVRIDQLKDGEIIDYSPAPEDFYQRTLDFKGTLSSAGWGDAIIMVPWTLYQRYGHKEVLLENYDAMVKWHNYSVKSAAATKSGNNQYIWDTTFHYGDLMFPSMMIGNPDPMKSAKATKDLVATAFLAHSSELLAKISNLLGKDGNQYIEYVNKVKIAFTNKFVKAGKLTSDYQGCYVLALAFDMVEEHNLKPQLLARLVELIRDKCPSWLYEVDHGATTIWESWAGIQPDGKVGTFSFNHYATGCVIDWFIRNVVGLNVIKPGYKELTINPKFKGIVNDFQMKYLSANGLFTIQLKDGVYKFSIPKGCKATIYPPDTDKFLKKYLHASIKNTRITVNSDTYQFLIA